LSPIRFEWVLPEGQTPGARKDLQAVGVVSEEPEIWEPDETSLDDTHDVAFEPMMVIAVSLSASVLIKVISDVVYKHRYPGGDLFDLRKGSLKRRPLPHEPQGTLVLITDDGQQFFEPAQRDEGLKFLTQAISAIGSAGG